MPSHKGRFLVSFREPYSQDAVALFDCTESVSGSSFSLQSSFSQYFSLRATCYSYWDVHELKLVN